VSPSSIEECESWKNAYRAYLYELEVEWKNCETEHSHDPVYTWLKGFRCWPGGHGANVPAACVSANNLWDCATSDFGRLLNECFASARAAVDSATKSLNDVLEKAAKGKAEDAAAALAKWWAGQSDPGVKALLQSAEKVSGHADTARHIQQILTSPDRYKRVEELTLLFNKQQNNKLAQELTKTAIHAVVTTNQQAAEAVTRSITNFNVEHDNARVRLSNPPSQGRASAPSHPSPGNAIHERNENQVDFSHAREAAKKKAEGANTANTAAREQVRRNYEEQRRDAERERKQLERKETERVERQEQERKAEAARRHEEEVRRQIAEEEEREERRRRRRIEAETIPSGWEACSCPWAHAAFGKIVRGVLYHPPGFSCP